MATKKLSIALTALTTPTFGAQVTMPSFKIGATAVTTTGVELNYVVGVTSAIQTQLTAKLASASYTAADVLAKMITVDGVASGLDADLLDGQHGAYYAPIANPTFTGTVTVASAIKGSGATYLDITQSSSDAADTRITRIGGGGDVSISRGGFMALYGNEAATYGGSILLNPGGTGYVLVNGDIKCTGEITAYAV